MASIPARDQSKQVDTHSVALEIASGRNKRPRRDPGTACARCSSKKERCVPVNGAQPGDSCQGCAKIGVRCSHESSPKRLRTHGLESNLVVTRTGSLSQIQQPPLTSHFLASKKSSTNKESDVMSASLLLQVPGDTSPVSPELLNRLSQDSTKASDLAYSAAEKATDYSTQEPPKAAETIRRNLIVARNICATKELMMAYANTILPSSARLLVPQDQTQSLLEVLDTTIAHLKRAFDAKYSHGIEKLKAERDVGGLRRSMVQEFQGLVSEFKNANGYNILSSDHEYQSGADYGYSLDKRNSTRTERRDYSAAYHYVCAGVSLETGEDHLSDATKHDLNYAAGQIHTVLGNLTNLSVRQQKILAVYPSQQGGAVGEQVSVRPNGCTIAVLRSSALAQDLFSCTPQLDLFCMTPIHVIAYLDVAEKHDSLLRSSMAQTLYHKKDHLGMTPFLIFASSGNYAMFRHIYQHSNSSDFQIVDSIGRNALQLAACNDQVDIIDEILQDPGSDLYRELCLKGLGNELIEAVSLNNHCAALRLAQHYSQYRFSRYDIPDFMKAEETAHANGMIDVVTALQSLQCSTTLESLQGLRQVGNLEYEAQNCEDEGIMQSSHSLGLPGSCVSNDGCIDGSVLEILENQSLLGENIYQRSSY